MKQVLEPLTLFLRRTQVNVLRACPPVCGMISDGALQARGSRAKNLFSLAAQVPPALLGHWRDRLKKRVVLGQVVFGVTTRCTLNCDKCLSHVPDLKAHRDTPAEELLADLHALFSCVDYIHDFCIGGGEPLLHPDLNRVIRACAASGKIGTVKVLTNGTVIPGEAVLAALRRAAAPGEARTHVNISDYPHAPQPDIEKIQAVLRENGISHTLFPADNDFWVDTDSFGPLKEGSPARRFSDCFFRLYYVYMNGQLHLCCKSAIMAHDGRLPARGEDFVSLRGIGPAAFRAQLKKLNKKTSVSACAYCLGNNARTPRIPAGVQRPICHDKEQ